MWRNSVCQTPSDFVWKFKKIHLISVFVIHIDIDYDPGVQKTFFPICFKEKQIIFGLGDRNRYILNQAEKSCQNYLTAPSATEIYGKIANFDQFL